MLLQFLPGVRHVRTPLLVGTLWIIFAWLTWARHIPAVSATPGVMSDFYRLCVTLGTPLVLAGLGTLAYLIGVVTVPLPGQVVITVLRILRMLLWKTTRPPAESESGIIGSYLLVNSRVTELEDLAKLARTALHSLGENRDIMVYRSLIRGH